MAGTQKTIIIGYVGGFLDGKEVRSDDESPSTDAWSNVSFVYGATKGGETGRGFWTASPAGLQAIHEEEYRGQAQPSPHYYYVISRDEDDETVTLTLKYSPTERKKNGTEDGAINE